MLGSFLPLPSPYAAEAVDSYQQHFKKYLGYTKAVDDRDICVERVEGRLQDKIERIKRTNEWYRSLGPEGEKYLEDEPDKIEKEVAGYVISICLMSLDDLHNLAQNYRYGRKGMVQDRDVAISLYIYMTHVYDDIDALHRLEDMGHIEGPPPTEEEMQAVYKKMEEQKIQTEKNKIWTKKFEEMLKKHIPFFPFSPE